MLTKILFAIDDSEYSLETIKYVKSLAQKYNAEVSVIHVFEEPFVYTIEYEEMIVSEKNEFLKQIKATFIEFGLNVETTLRKGHIGKLIVEKIEEGNFDFVVMGKHGINTYKSILLGSSSNYVVHHSKCPVLLV